MIESIILALQLASTQPSLPNIELYLQEKPPIAYSQYSEEFAYYKNLAFGKGASKLHIKEALDFYNFIIDERKHIPHLAEAYLYSGRLICCAIDDKDIDESMHRLKQAYNLATDKRIKAEALFTLGIIEKDYSNVGYKNFSLRNAKRYLEEVIELLPQSDLAKESKRILRRTEFKKIK